MKKGKGGEYWVISKRARGGNTPRRAFEARLGIV